MASIWVFVSTIGELNAIEVLLRPLLQRLPQLSLVLISDRPQYAQAYALAYPAAHVHLTAGRANEAQALAKTCPPEMLLVAEIPCMPFDAPCRFSSGFVAEARRLRAPVALVNGWLYAGRSASRLDALEARLFTRAYLRAFDVMAVQTPEVKRQLLARGAIPGAVVATGNLKFDNVVARPPTRPFALRLARQASGSGRHVLVAGSVNDTAELNAVVAAFGLWKLQDPHALLVLAPRHPEDGKVRARVERTLDDARLEAQWLSHAPDAPIVNTTDCVVLDTFGDLRDCYAVCDLAHVGINHNVLEPIAHRRPVTVMPGWRPDFPSFPVYTELMELGAITSCSDAAALAQAWNGALARPAEGSQVIETAMSAMRGATARCMQALEPLIARIETRHPINDAGHSTVPPP